MKTKPSFYFWLACSVYIAITILTVPIMAQENSESSATNENAAETDDKASENAPVAGLRMNFRNVPLEMVLDYLSEAAGFAIIAETDVSGEVSVWNNKPLSKDEAVSVLDSILNEQGYAAIRVGNVLKIVAKSDAQTENLPVRTGNDPAEIPQTDRMITQIIPVRYTGAADLIDNLEPLLPAEASMTANENSNAVVLTGTENSIRRVAEIIRALDTSISGISQLQVFPLQYSDANELAEVIKNLFEPQQSSSRRGSSSRGSSSSFFDRMRFGRGGDSGSSRGGSSRGSSRGGGDSEALNAATRVVAVADERTNSLVVSAPEEIMPTIVQLVEEIDKNVDDITELRVFPLKFADAFEMSEILENLFDENGGSSNESRGGFRFGRGPFGSSFGGGSDRGGRRSSDNDNSSRVQALTRVTAVPDPRTNSIIVSASSILMEQIGRMIEQLDSDSSKKQKVYVYSLDNADVDNVAMILRGMFESQSNLNNRNNADRTGRNTNNPLNNRSINQQNFSIGGGGAVGNR